MTLSAKTVAIGELAAALGRSEEWLRRHWRKLQAEAGMPPRVPGTWVWPRSLVEQWIEQRLPCEAATAEVVTPIAALIANENQRLRNRIGRARA